MTTKEIEKIGKSKKVSKGAYLYEGKNFNIEFDNDMGYWAVDEYSIELKTGKNIEVEFYQFETKKDLLWALRNIDAQA